MKAFLKIIVAFAVAGASFVASTALAQTDQSVFRISVIREASSADLIRVGRDWRKDLPKRILVTLRVQEDLPQAGVKVKAYFYDKDYNLVYSSASPNAVWTKSGKGFTEVALPVELKKGQPFDVYFALPEAATKAKWKNMVIVFGKDKELVARARPINAMEHLSFPEKEQAILLTN